MEQKLQQVQQQREQFRMLLLSDIHMQEAYIELLQKYQQENKKEYDAIFLLGDFDNLKINKELPREEIEKMSQESDENISKILRQINDIYPNVQQYFIPGNHDSQFLFEGKQYGLLNSRNIHKQTIKLQNGLTILGFGGSIPFHYQDDNSELYIGYPFTSDKEFQQEISGFLKENFKDGEQILLATHIGPHHTSTTKHFEQERVGISGSQFLYDTLYSESEKLKKTGQGANVILDMHGHTHDASGMSWVKNTRVINPGTLSWGLYGEITLQRPLDGKWDVESVNFNKLQC